MSAIEPTTTVEQYGTNVRVTQDWTSVLDKMARDIADRIDEATLARLGYVKRGTCRLTDSGPWGHPYVCSACCASFDPEVYDGKFNYCPNCGRRIEEVDE